MVEWGVCLCYTLELSVRELPMWYALCKKNKLETNRDELSNKNPGYRKSISPIKIWFISNLILKFEFIYLIGNHNSNFSYYYNQASCKYLNLDTAAVTGVSLKIINSVRHTLFRDVFRGNIYYTIFSCLAIPSRVENFFCINGVIFFLF